MASPLEVQKRSLEAVQKLTGALTRLGAELGIEPVSLTDITYRRDPAYEQMLRYEALAAWADQIAEAAPARKKSKKAAVEPDAETAAPAGEVPPPAETPPAVEDSSTAAPAPETSSKKE